MMTYAEYQIRHPKAEFYRHFGSFIRSKRERLGLSQSKYCKYINDTALDHIALSKIEHGVINVGLYRGYMLMTGPDHWDRTKFMMSFACSLTDDLWIGYGNLRQFALRTGCAYSTLNAIFAGKSDPSLYLISYIMYALREGLLDVKKI